MSAKPKVVKCKRCNGTGKVEFYGTRDPDPAMMRCEDCIGKGKVYQYHAITVTHTPIRD